LWRRDGGLQILAANEQSGSLFPKGGERNMRKKRPFFHTILFVAVLSSLNFLLTPSGRGEPKSGVVRFMVMVDGPYREEHFPIIRRELVEMSSEVDFVVHAGDILKHECSAERLSKSAQLFQFSQAPFFVLIGDNEYNGCICPDDSLRNWRSTFSRFRENWKGQDNVSYQQGRPENAFFAREKILFVFLSIQGAHEFSRVESDRRMGANLLWLRHGIESHQDTVDAIVVFGHGGLLRSTNKRYSAQFAKVFESARKPAFYFHGSIEGIRADRHLLLLEKNYLGVSNLTRVGVEQAGEVPSLLVAISTGESVKIALNRRRLQYPTQNKRDRRTGDDTSLLSISLVHQYEYWVWVVKSEVSVFLKCNMPWLYRFLTGKQTCSALICNGVLPTL